MSKVKFEDQYMYIDGVMVNPDPINPDETRFTNEQIVEYWIDAMRSRQREIENIREDMKKLIMVCKVLNMNLEPLKLRFLYQ